MAYNPNNPNGQATSANSSPVVISSDQPAVPVSGPLTDAQLRASTVPISGTVTANTGLSQPLTDTQLRAAAVSVSGAVTANAGANLNTSLLALDSTVAKDSSLGTIDTSVNTLLKPASTLAAVTSITNPVAVTNSDITSLNTKTPSLGSASAAASQPITPASENVTGSLTALNQTVEINTQGVGTAIFELSGTWVGTVTFEGSNNNFTTVQSITSIFLGGLQPNSATTTTNGFFSVVTAGFQKVRAKMTSYTSGSASVVANGTLQERIIVPLQGNGDNLITKASGAATTGDPTYTTGTTNPLSLNTAGALRVERSDLKTSGNITTQNLVPAGTATANSAVEITLNGANTLVVQTTGTYTGALTLQATTGATNVWATITGNVFYNINTLGAAATITSATQGIFRVDVAGYSKVRITGLAAMTGTATVTLNSGSGTGYVSLQNPIPTGSNSIGTVLLGSGTVSSVTSSQSAIPGIIADVASAAITTTTTTAAFTPTFGTSFSIVIPVTAATGTTPTMDVQVQVSDDTGTNWLAVYDFPRITTTGIYRSPVLMMTGNRVRYVQTITGTTPSFTRTINRLQSTISSNTYFRQMIDRTINPNVLNSTTASLYVGMSTNIQLVINMLAGGTPPALQLEGSDDYGATWYSLAGALAGAAGSTVQGNGTSSMTTLIRARVSTAGAGSALGYVVIKSYF